MTVAVAVVVVHSPGHASSDVRGTHPTPLCHRAVQTVLSTWDLLLASVSSKVCATITTYPYQEGTKLVTPYRSTPHHTTPHHITPHYTTPHHTTPHHTTPHNATQRNAKHHHPTPSQRTPSHHATSNDTISHSPARSPHACIQVVRSCMQQRSPKASHFATTLGTFRHLWRDDGFRAFYRGIFPHVLRSTPQARVATCPPMFDNELAWCGG